MALFNYEVSPVMKDGYCFFASLSECLLRDHNMRLSVKDIARIIQSDIYENNEFYKKSYCGSIQEMLNALDEYVKNGKWCQTIGDIVVFAAANCLNMNMCIFKNINGRALLYFVRSCTPSDRDIYLKYDHDHYDAIVWKGDPDPLRKEDIDYFREQGVYFTHHTNSIPNTTTPLNTQKPTVEDLGSDTDTTNGLQMGTDKQMPDRSYTQPSYIQNPNPQKSTSYGDTYKDIPNRTPVPDKFQFEENYSGVEDAVLNNSQISESDIELDNTSRMSSPITVPDGNSDNVNSDSMSSTFLSDSSSTSTYRIKPRKYSKTKLDPQRMERCKVEEVTTIPWDINGDHIYELDATETNYWDKYRDGRSFRLKNGSRKGFNGIRKTGCCQGSHICEEKNCPKLTSEGIVNTSAFVRIGNNLRECGSCGHIAQQHYCGAIKVIEFDQKTGKLRCYHQGEHICTVKPNVVERKKVLETLPIPISGSTKAKKFMYDCFIYYVENNEINKAFDLCDEVSEVDLRDKIKKMRLYPNKSVAQHDICESFLNIAHFQSSIKKSGRDKFLLYKWECEELGGFGTYVFKTSEVCLEIALKMAGKLKIGQDESSLTEEPAYFDGMHKRVKDFMTLTLWVFHPGMRMMNILAVMECPREDTFNIVLFFRTFNKALAEFLDEDEYMWDPLLLMMDEKGANFEAVTLVFGENFTKTKTVSCQWHFKNCAEKYITEVPSDTKAAFRRYCDELCEAHTRQRYKEVSDLIMEVVEKYKFMGWWKFWCPRGAHLIPALRGFNLPKMNLAEVGQSTMRAHRKMWLTEAAFADIAAIAFQSSNYRKFLGNKEKIMGRGPTLKKRNAREKATERKFVQQVDDVLFRGNLEAEGEKTVGPIFTPSKKASYRAPKNPKKGRQGQEDDAIYDDVIIIDSPVKPQRKKNPQRRGRGQNPKFAENPVRLIPNNNYEEERKIKIPEDFEKEYIQANRVYYIVLDPKKKNLISRCRGCHGNITEGDKKPPRNMLFLHKLRREIPPKGGKGQWIYSQDRRNCYFHARDFRCLKAIPDLTEITESYIYMPNKSYEMLTNENIEVLEARGHWDAIVENRRSVLRTGRLPIEYN